MESKTSLKKILVLSSLVLLISWFVPDVLSSPPVFPFQLIGFYKGAELFSLVAMPVAACLVLALAVLSPRDKLLSFAALPLALIETFAPLMGYFRLPVGKGVAITVVALGLVAGMTAITFFRQRITGFAILALAPAGLLITALIGLLSGAPSSAFLLALKTPVCLHASLLATVAAIEGAAILQKQEH
jgi:hypothetical protein